METRKKYKLKGWVKTLLLLLAFSLIVVIGAKEQSKAIDQCIASGNSESFCRYQLER